MRTSIELSDGLLDRARKLARKRRTTLRALVEEGLHRVLTERESGVPFRLEEVTFGEGGMNEGVSEGDWEQIRDLSYEGRGA